MRKRRAFTLIEISCDCDYCRPVDIFFSSITISKNQAKLTICMSRQWQIVLTRQIYYASHGDYPEHAAAVKTTARANDQLWNSPGMAA